MGKVIQWVVFILIVIASVVLSVFAKKWVNNFYSPEILFDVRKYDFDTLKTSDSSYYYFKYRNIGNGELKIYNIKTSCGCTIPYWNESFLKKNETDSFRVEYDKINKGYFIKEIMVYSNSKTSPDRLEISGLVPFD
ncbi:DUF1573 domain-containing protein [Fontibacter flavus]|jgi:hypothetical protein|uniref:DUF1573 domain-containing protein n=1 Tax=Fontibacter flavus TaxID=654838 RepID=A0ABV6FSA2_9BACT